MPASATAPRAERAGGTVWRGLAWAVLVGFVLLQVWGLYLAVPDQGDPLFPVPPGTDKVVHAVLFAVPTFLAVVLRRPWVLGALVLHAVVAEPLQGWLTTTRVPDVWDLVANLVGVLCGVVCGVLVARRGRGRRLQGASARARTDMLVR